MMEDSEIKYIFHLEDNKKLSFKVDINRDHAAKDLSSRPEWTRLDYHKCSTCPLNSEQVSHCPVAVDVQEIVSSFSELLSYKEAKVYVESPERFYYKKTDIQTGLKGLIGLVMATSACPILSSFKGMAHFHLPFASVYETIMRCVSFYLMKKLYIHRGGGDADYSLEGLQQQFNDIAEVNTAFIDRIRNSVKYDANLNAIVILHSDTTFMTSSLEMFLGQLEEILADPDSPYIRTAG